MPKNINHVLEIDQIPGVVRQAFYLHADQWQYLRDYAHVHSLSMSEVVRELIDTLDINNPAITGTPRKIHYPKFTK